MILSVMRAGWLNLRRDRAALMLSFVVPIVFFSIFAGLFARRNTTPKVSVVIADEDRSDNSRRLIEALRAEPALKVRTADDTAAATALVKRGTVPVAIIIPKGFGTTRIRFGQQQKSDAPAFRLLTDSADPIAPQVANGLLQKTIMTAMPELMMDGGVEAMDKWSGGLTPEQRASLDKNMAWLRAQPAAKRRQGGGELINITMTDVVGETKRNPVVALFAAGIGVMFLLFTASNGGGALLEEAESGTLDRILTTRLTLTQLLLGKLVYLWTLGTLQLIVMFTWGAVVFRLELLRHLGGFAIMALATTLATSAFGLFLASLSRTRAQLGAISTLVVLTVSAIGGSMFPRFLMPEWVQKAGLVLFNSWALDGFTNVFWREEPLTVLVAPVAVLIGYALVFFVIARQLTRRWETA
ncbi:MAG TPA: ABC transporter permease [Thermoanaerobaculia bacterium]|nr:ABC transporter permease [Thermoanaerobaculia bacterium]